MDDKREHDRFAAKLHRESSPLSVQQDVFEHGEVSSPSLTIVTVNSENKPRGLYFSKALFEGLIFGGAYLRREICVSKSIGLAL